MTAEVAVINRLAVALAADSAVTIERGSSIKIFQSENKLFQLSNNMPIGIMIYNSASYFGIPWELIIKDFTGVHSLECAQTLFDVVPIFIKFLEENFMPSAAQQSLFVESLLAAVFDEVFHKFVETTFDLQFGPRKVKESDRAYRSKFNDILDTSIRAMTDYDSLDEYTIDEGLEFVAFYQKEFDKCYARFFKHLPLKAEEASKIRELAARALKNNKTTDVTTGLVFAGYGRKEIFPSLSCVELNGVIASKLKKLQLEKIDIDRAEKTGAVIPFAQREAADSLLYGRSDDYEFTVTKHFEDVIDQIASGIIDVAVKGKAKKKELLEKARQAKDEAIARFRDSVAPEIRDSFFGDILDTIKHMPKQELAAFAEALVSVTSIKRKVSVGPETVGGPIDVAVISRHEGFVWVKRKLYFPADLNPRYAWRNRRALDVAAIANEAGVPHSDEAPSGGGDEQPA